ncbi:MAG: glycosyl hydrolase [Firmicutes bacterium]|nr:glycosyl hydrolase [Bacillota bacterium]
MENRVIPPAPLFRDPIYDGPTDPVIIWNREEKCWWILYTQRRSTDVNIGVSSIHGTKIGVASSRDGAKWLYRGTLPNLDIEPGHNTFWAPEVIYAEGKYHMYVSYIQGVPTDWQYPRHIVHYTADNLWDWKFESILELSSDKVIDACVHQLDSGEYKMWYKDEGHSSHTYTAISKDLYKWEVLGPEITDGSHEGANVFVFGGKKWMITDRWDGLAVYQSDDFTNWTRCGENILREPGKRPEDSSIGNHADVLVINDQAYIFYFVHPEFPKEERRNRTKPLTYKEARTVLQVAKLEVKDGCLVCDRDAEFYLELLVKE